MAQDRQSRPGRTSRAPPPIFPTVQDFDAAAEDYFAACDAADTLYGEAGLCLALSRGNGQGRTVTLAQLRSWYDGEDCPWLREAVHRCYLRIQNQIETDPRYRGMSSRAIFLQKQSRLGGYQDRPESKNDTTVRILFGRGMTRSDFK